MSELSFRLKIWPDAFSTPSRALTFTSTDAGTVGEPLCENETVDLPVITAAVSLYEPAKIWSNADLIVSVRTYVPLTMATPSTIASAVRSARSLRLDEPLERDGDHVRLTSSTAAMISAAVERPTSLTMRPSAR